MSVFTSAFTKVLELPSDPGQSITIRKLAPKHLKAAMKAAQKQAMADLRDMGGAAFLEELNTLKTGAETPAAAAADPLLVHDAVTLLEHGIVAWTYAQERSREVLEDLDSDVQEWIAREILRLAKPSLCADYDAERERKNGAASFSVH